MLELAKSTVQNSQTSSEANTALLLHFAILSHHPSPNLVLAHQAAFYEVDFTHLLLFFNGFDEIQGKLWILPMICRKAKSQVK
ncbi:hypothetical protein LJC19_04945 [Oxalobacter sp. OttesenSCG-928-P03]|nr:hypothetical protein [Oxalobacter sp. OttesenSCG-928-P03]